MPAVGNVNALTYLDGGRRLLDCSKCGHAARIELHGDRLDVRCFAGCDQDAALAGYDLGRLRAEIVASELEARARRRREEPRLRLISVADVRMQPVAWLWRDLVPLRKVTVLAGPPGQGKSTFATHLAALASMGSAPGHLAGQPAHVVIASAEDDPEDTIKPRLVAAGADQRLVSLMDMREQGPDGPVGGLIQLPRDALEVERAVQRVGARLVVFDPVVAFLDADHSAHREQDVRAALAPLKAMAERQDCAVVAVMHPNKADGNDPLRRIANSGAFTALARSVLLLGPDPEDEDGDRRILALVKGNTRRAGHGCGLLLRIRQEVVQVEGQEPIPAPAVEVLGESTVDASELLGTREERSALGDATVWLRDLLADGPAAQKEIRAAAEEAGHSWRTVRRAKLSAGVKSMKLGGPGEPWAWALPGDEVNVSNDPPMAKGGQKGAPPRALGPLSSTNEKVLAPLGKRAKEDGGEVSKAGQGGQAPPLAREVRPYRGVFEAPAPCPACGGGLLLEDEDRTIRCAKCGDLREEAAA
jgi:putative DNA primase/helicase